MAHIRDTDELESTYRIPSSLDLLKNAIKKLDYPSKSPRDRHYGRKTLRRGHTMQHSNWEIHVIFRK